MAELTFYRDPTTRLDSVSRSYKGARDSHQKQKQKKNGKKEPCQMIHEISSSRRLANQLIERMNVQTQTPHSGHKMWISGFLSHYYYSSSSLCCADCCWARESTFLFASSGTIRHGSRAIRFFCCFSPTIQTPTRRQHSSSRTNDRRRRRAVHHDQRQHATI